MIRSFPWLARIAVLLWLCARASAAYG